VIQHCIPEEWYLLSTSLAKVHNFSCRDQLNKFRGTGVYQSTSDQYNVTSPVSSADHSSIIIMLHQLQQDIADIRHALHVDQDMPTVMHPGTAGRCYNERKYNNQPSSVRQWTRPASEIQQTQGILRRLHQNRSLRGVVVWYSYTYWEIEVLSL